MGILKNSLAFIFAFIHASFFLLITLESNNLNYLMGLMILPLYFLLPFHFFKPSTKQWFINCTYFGLGFYLTQITQYFIPPVAASALVGTAFCLLSENKRFKIKTHQNVFYAGCFAGMSAFDWFPHYGLTIITCLIGGTVFSIFKKSLIGFGGKLGTIGFASVIIWLILQWH